MDDLAPPSPSPKKILAVDDDALYQEALETAFRREGYDVILARSGGEALELLAAQPVDCILLDVLMPGLSGHETCKRIKGTPALRDIPLVMLTAVHDSEAVIEGINAGADDYVAKSSNIEVLRARVRAQLRRRQFEEEGRRRRGELLLQEKEALEAQHARELAETRAALLLSLERKNVELIAANRELEAFSYTVSHDLRAPLRVIDGFGRLLLKDCGGQLDDTGKGHLAEILENTQRMRELIEDLLELSRVTRADLTRGEVSLSELVREVLDVLRRRDPERRVELVIREGVIAIADPRLLRTVLENLLGNAWKFTSRAESARIEFGVAEGPGAPGYFVRDDGAGFDMAYADKLYRPFQRLHGAEFEGTGIGLATVRRIIERHGGALRAEGAVGAGATFYFTL
jgi:two-component system NtrC family sensor kinase